MDSVLRAVVIYLVILLLLRLTGKRTLAQLTTIDFVLLLIMSEATQQALLSDDYSVTNFVLVVTTLALVDRTADWLKFHFTAASRVAEGMPVVLVEHGRPLDERLRKEHISTDDILASARKDQGLLRMEDIEYAVLERSGGISIIPAGQNSDSESARSQDSS